MKNEHLFQLPFGSSERGDSNSRLCAQGTRSTAELNRTKPLPNHLPCLHTAVCCCVRSANIVALLQGSDSFLFRARIERSLLHGPSTRATPIYLAINEHVYSDNIGQRFLQILRRFLGFCRFSMPTGFGDLV
jgi:hypothetical protein